MAKYNLAYRPVIIEACVFADDVAIFARNGGNSERNPNVWIVIGTLAKYSLVPNT